jgi:hypothetical protein
MSMAIDNGVSSVLPSPKFKSLDELLNVCAFGALQFLFQNQYLRDVWSVAFPLFSEVKIACGKHRCLSVVALCTPFQNKTMRSYGVWLGFYSPKSK